MQKIKRIKWATTLKIKRKKREKTARNKNGEIHSSKKNDTKIYYEFSKISGIMRVDTTCIMSVIYKVPANEIPP